MDPLRAIVIHSVIGKFIGEIQLVFSPNPSSKNSHMNHILYEIIRCDKLSDIANALNNIGAIRPLKK
jgi:hypothetical protein